MSDELEKQYLEHLKNVELDKLTKNSTSSNKKGNKYHASDGKFTFSPYNSHPNLKTSVDKIVTMRKSVEAEWNNQKDEKPSEKMQTYLNSVAEERQKLHKEYGEDFKKSDKAIENWLFGGVDYRSTGFSQADKDLSQAIFYEMKKETTCYRSHRNSENPGVMNKSEQASWTTNFNFIIDGTKGRKTEKTDIFEQNVTRDNLVMMPDVLYSQAKTRDLYFYQKEYVLSNNKAIKAKESYQSFEDFRKKYNALHLNAHFTEEGALDEYGQAIQSQIEVRKQAFVSEIQKVQLEAIRNANTKLTLNAFDYRDIRTDEQEKQIYEKIKSIIKRYWLFLFGLISRERLAEDKNLLDLETQKKVFPLNILGFGEVNRYVDKSARQDAESHTKTIFKRILAAVNKAEEKATENLFISEYKKENPETELSDRKIKTQLKNPEFVHKNQEMYDFVKKKIDEGYGRQEIQRVVRLEYTKLSRQAASTLVETETARAITSSQYWSDYELLKKAGFLDRAYKRLESMTGDPCPICAELIKKGDVPFNENFMSLGDILEIESEGKTIQFTCDFEDIQSGVIHPNCHCSYKLVIK